MPVIITKIRLAVGSVQGKIQESSTKRKTSYRPVRLAYQPPASSTFLSEQISHQQLLFSQNKPAPAISHQPNEQTACYPKGKGIKIEQYVYTETSINYT
jgi:hypothetical protein